MYFLSKNFALGKSKADNQINQIFFVSQMSCFNISGASCIFSRVSG